MNSSSFKNTIYKLGSLLSIQDRKILVLLIFVSVAVSLIETIGIAAIMPFISVASDPNYIHSNEYLSLVYKLFSFESHMQFTLAFGLSLVFYYIFRGVVNIFYYHVLSKFSNTKYHQISCRLFQNYLELSYRDFTNRNTSAMTKVIATEAFNYSAIIFSALFMLSEIIIVVFIYAAMLYVNFKITLSLTLFLAINSVLMISTISPRIKSAGVMRESAVKKLYEVINKSFGNYKLLKVYLNNADSFELFKRANFKHARSNITNQTLNQVPRLFLETTAFIIVIFIVIYLIYEFKENISELLAMVSVFVLALYRLMPSASRIMNNYNSILFNSRSLDLIHRDLLCKGERLGNKSISFKRNIVLKDIFFEHETGHPVLNGVNLNIKKGSSVAIIGESGSGKSTLVDILMGLHKTKSGEILIDGTKLTDLNMKSWRGKIGYIPQSIYLFDGTVGENIAFGSEYNERKVDKVLKIASMYDFLNTKNGRDTKVGERGVMLSGGQIQRIAIARALYDDPEIIVMDEASSALDGATEDQIMKEIYNISKNKTLIIISHKVSTLYRCDQIYKLSNGELIILT